VGDVFEDADIGRGFVRPQRAAAQDCRRTQRMNYFSWGSPDFVTGAVGFDGVAPMNVVWRQSPPILANPRSRRQRILRPRSIIRNAVHCGAPMFRAVSLGTQRGLAAPRPPAL